MNTQECKCGSQAQNNFCSNCGEPDIFQLVRDDNHEELKRVLKKYRYDLEAKEEHSYHLGYSALILAVINGKTECLKILLEQGANIEARNRCGKTALIFATQCGHIDCLKVLLQRADIEAKDNSGQTALVWATKQHRTKLLKLLLKHGAVVSPETKEKYSRYTELWPKEKPSLLTSVGNMKHNN